MQETIEGVLTRVIATKARLEPSLVVPEATLSELGVTSLDLVEIIMTIEDDFDVSVPVNAAEAWANFRTVGDLINLGRSLELGGRLGEP